MLLAPPTHRLAAVGYADLRLAVVSPFVDRRHGTERALAELLERLARIYHCEIHLYSQRVEDLALEDPDALRTPDSGAIYWHKVPSVPGPHLLAYLWWFFANHIQRFWDVRVHGLNFDLLYSPGINAFDADAISVHIVFQEFYRRVRPRLSFRGAPLSLWPILLHRHFYYGLICFLERRIYACRHTALTAISRHAADCLAEFYRRDDVCIVRHGVDIGTFHPAVRAARRDAARASFQIAPSEFCLLLIGNDWKSKGLDALLQAMSHCADLPLKLLVAGTDDRRNYAETIGVLHLEGKVRFLDPSPDVVQFYAAADAYVGPSLEDAYGLPILEAMACGLPVIASARAGASEILRDAENGFLLRNPEDSLELAGLLRCLCSDPAPRLRIGEEAARTAAQESWDRHAADTWEFLNAVLRRRAASPPA